MLVKTILELSGENGGAGAEAQSYLDALRGEFRHLLEAARDRGEIGGLDPVRLARLYQTKLIALKIESQCGLGAADLHGLADDMADEIAGLRVTAASGPKGDVSLGS